MAGRYVVLSFESHFMAEAFVSQEEAMWHDGAQLVGVFTKPDQFCECPDKRRQTVQNWARGKRTGIWLCKVCKKPSKHHQGGILDRLKMALGYNLWEND